MFSHRRFPVFGGPLAITTCLLAAGAGTLPNAAVAQDVRARQVGSIVEMRGSCGLINITIAHPIEGKLEPIHVKGSIRKRDGSASFHGVRTVPAGDYVIASVMCQVLRDKFTQAGPHAKFQVRAGEFVDVGTLHVAHKMDPGFLSSTGTLQRSVSPTSPEKLAHYKSKYPRLMSKRVVRQMALAGPAETTTKRKGLW